MLSTLIIYRPVLVLLVILFISDGRSVPDTQVGGTWDAHFVGKVRGTGSSQTDTFVMDLKQDGSRVKGTIVFKGLNVAIPVTGKVTGTTLSYTGKASIGPKCEAEVVGETTVDDAAGRIEGSQTQSNCEGTAIGKVTAVRR